MSRISKFVGWLPIVSQSFDIERTDGGGASGPHSISLTDGKYLLEGRPVAIVTSSTGSPTVGVSGGHDFEEGESVSIWDESADSLFGTYTVDAATSTTLTMNTGVSASANDIIFKTGDLIGRINARVKAQDYANLSGFDLEISNSNGRLSLTPSSETFLMSSITADLIEYLRTAANGNLSASAASPYEGSRAVAFSFYPSKALVDNRMLKRKIVSRALVAANGSQEILSGDEHRLQQIGLRFLGFEREDSYNEFHAIEDFWGYATDGKHFRWWPDKTVNSPYAQVSNPWGYEDWTFEGNPPFALEEPIAGTFDIFDERIVIRQYVPDTE